LRMVLMKMLTNPQIHEYTESQCRIEESSE
jgi:hypothetical protein